MRCVGSHAVQQQGELNDRKEYVDFSLETRPFSTCVKEDIQWIIENKIPGTWRGHGQDIHHNEKVFGEHCKTARKVCQYSEAEVARCHAYKTHTY